MATAIIDDLLKVARRPFQSITSGSINRRIFGAATAIAAVTIWVKLAAMVKEMLVAWRFGTRDDLDAFTLALVLPFTLINVFAVPFRTAFLPLYIHTDEREGQRPAARLLAGAMLWISGLLLILTLLMVLTGPLYLPLLASGFSPNKLRLTFHLLCFLSPLVLLSGLSELWGGILNARGRFALVAALPIISAALTIVLLQRADVWGVWALLAGMIAGAILELGVLGFCLKQQRISLDWKDVWRSLRTDLRGVQGHAATLMTGSLLMSGVSIICASLLARFPAGSLAAFSYANKIVALPIGLLSVALNTAAAPFLAQLTARQEWSYLRQTLMRYISLIFGFAVPVTAGLFLLAQPVTSLLLQRGAFAANDSRLVANLLACLALQLPFYIASGFVVQMLIAMQATRAVLLISACNLLVLLVLSPWLSARFGIAGVALAISAMYFVAFWLAYLFAAHRIKIYNAPV
ncbi:MAG TPA: lipid II flippase MurJ [Blastocatellia bacterium]|nr:lipid II flippase MurJ [Blastocatellia bacterium]